MEEINTSDKLMEHINMLTPLVVIKWNKY